MPQFTYISIFLFLFIVLILESKFSKGARKGEKRSMVFTKPPVIEQKFSKDDFAIIKLISNGAYG